MSSTFYCQNSAQTIITYQHQIGLGLNFQYHDVLRDAYYSKSFAGNYYEYIPKEELDLGYCFGAFAAAGHGTVYFSFGIDYATNPKKWEVFADADYGRVVGIDPVSHELTEELNAISPEVYHAHNDGDFYNPRAFVPLPYSKQARFISLEANGSWPYPCDDPEDLCHLSYLLGGGIQITKRVYTARPHQIKIYLWQQ